MTINATVVLKAKRWVATPAGNPAAATLR